MSQRERRDNRRPAPTTSTTTITRGPTVTTTSSTTYTAAGPQTTVVSNAPGTSTIVHPTVTTTHNASLLQASRGSPLARSEQQPSIRIRRSGGELSPQTQTQTDDEDGHGNRRRSFSQPERPQPALLRELDDLEIRRYTSATPLGTLREEGSGYSIPQLRSFAPVVPSRDPRRPVFPRQTSAISLRRSRGAAPGEFDADVVDVLDVLGMFVSS